MSALSGVSVRGLASEAYGWFEVVRRVADDEDSEFVRLRDGSPVWVGDLVRVAHGDLLSDDWRYETIRAALAWIAECDDPADEVGEFADATVDVYTSGLIAWLGSNMRRLSYCDEAVEEYGPPDPDSLDRRIAVGQYVEADEVFGLVLGALEERLEEVGGDA